MAAIINQARLRQYLKLNYNVLFIGLHGVGKTAVIKSAFTEAYGDRWKYFSASTLDPWVDFVGVPKSVDDPKGGQYLDLIRPKFIKYDEVEAIFFDEFNRAPDKVINAVMELIQFKSINGHKLNNLKVVWAAINPEDEDDTYSVNHLDPAQLDRFQVHLQIPYKVDEDYFEEKYPMIGPLLCQWWNALPGDIQKLVSPRRLDYAADAHVNNCRLEDFLPNCTNVTKLRKLLQSIPFHKQLKSIKTEAEAGAFLADVNNTTTLLELVKSNDPSAIEFFKSFGKKIPQELAAPFVDFAHARASGLEHVKSLEELIEKLPNDPGNQGTAAIINNVSFETIYKSGGSIEGELRGLYAAKPNMVAKLSNKCFDIIMNCQKLTLERVLWGVAAKAGNTQTNFHKIILVLTKIGGCFADTEKKKINEKLYRSQLVDSTNYLK